MKTYHPETLAKELTESAIYAPSANRFWAPYQIYAITAVIVQIWGASAPQLYRTETGAEGLEYLNKSRPNRSPRWSSKFAELRARATGTWLFFWKISFDATWHEMIAGFGNAKYYSV